MPETLTNVTEPTTYDKLSVSELGTLLRCTQKHDYAYRQGLVPIETPEYFSKGTYLHTVMEHWLLSPELPLNDIFDQALWTMRDREKSPVGEADRLEINKTVTEFVRLIGTPEFTVEAVEVEFYVDLGLYTGRDEGHTPVLLHGVIDGVVRGPDGDLWLVEHKTTGRAWSQGHFNFDFQGPLYMDAWEALTFERPVGILYNFFYPRGRFETKQIYHGAEDGVLIREEVQRALELRDSGLVVRQPHWGCNDCGFKDICFAELRGQDTTLAREYKFTVDTDRQERFHE